MAQPWMFMMMMNKVKAHELFVSSKLRIVVWRYDRRLLIRVFTEEMKR
jgi:hypothetical protein